MINYIEGVLNHTSLSLNVGFPNIAFEYGKLSHHRFDLWNIGNFVRAYRAMKHVCCVVLPIVNEEVFDEENQRPVKVVEG